MLAIAGGIILGFFGIVLIVRAMYRHELRRKEREAGLPRGILSMSERQLAAWMQATAEAEAKAQARAEAETRRAVAPAERMNASRILTICFGLFFLFGWAYLIWSHMPP
jgi:hypothetical protein